MSKKLKIKKLTRQLELERNSHIADIGYVRHQRDGAWAARDTLVKEHNSILTAFDIVRDERDQLQADYEGIAYKYADMRTERNEVLKERDGLHGRQKLLKVERDQLITKVDIVRDERDERAANYKYAIDTLVNERDAARTERNTLHREVKSLGKDRDKWHDKYDKLLKSIGKLFFKFNEPNDSNRAIFTKEDLTNWINT